MASQRNVALLLLVTALASAGCLGDGRTTTIEPGRSDATDSPDNDGGSSSGGGSSSTNEPDPSDGGGNGGSGSGGTTTTEPGPPNDTEILRYSDTIDCVFALPDTPAEGETFYSCEPTNPEPYNDGDRKPWVAELDLTEEGLARFGFEASAGSRADIKFTWVAAQGDNDRFQFCRTDPRAADGTGKACSLPAKEQADINTIELRETLFKSESAWSDPGKYQVWVEPIEMPPEAILEQFGIRIGPPRVEILPSDAPPGAGAPLGGLSDMTMTIEVIFRTP